MRVLGAVGMGHLMAHESESDNNSTNLYVTNLYRTVTEDILMETFGRYGPLASVKVMWPRNEEERATKMHNSGFVGFMVRFIWEYYLKLTVLMKSSWYQPTERCSAFVPPTIGRRQSHRHQDVQC